jgi:hypothetical protein
MYVAFFPETWADAEADILSEMTGMQKRSLAMRREISEDDDKIDCCSKALKLMAERGNKKDNGDTYLVALLPLAYTYSQVMICRDSCLWIWKTLGATSSMR